MLVQWLFDKLGYMPKISVDATWGFPVQAEPQVKKVAKKVAKKTASKTTTRKTK